VLFTDLVASTERMASLGDQRWGELLEQHHRAVRRELGAYGGLEIDTAGDGFFCRFDGPARAIVCAQRIVEDARSIDLSVRAGVHTGECELVGAKIAGIAVAVGARISAVAKPGEVVVSRTVRDLVAGSGIEFEDRGEQVLKGVPGMWQLFTVKDLGPVA
jgi:class 3 adenylate cyclase